MSARAASTFWRQPKSSTTDWATRAASTPRTMMVNSLKNSRQSLKSLDFCLRICPPNDLSHQQPVPLFPEAELQRLVSRSPEQARGVHGDRVAPDRAFRNL